MIREFDTRTIGEGLAFTQALADLHGALDAGTSVVISSPPGTGKTTLVPPVLANRSGGRVIVTQPRRVAARAAARRLAQLDRSNVGDRVGFTVRGERRASAVTRIEFVTAGVLLRRMLADPGLDGVQAVILDEVHERALETDLLIGLLGEVRVLRDDLTLIAMSATLDAAAVADVLGDGMTSAPVVTQTLPAFPLDERWAPPPAPRLDERGVTRTFLDHVARVTAGAAHELARSDPRADALVFAPGAREVSEIARRTRDLAPDWDVRELHGRIPVSEQDAVIGGRRADEPPRIIVTTSVAESSLTVPGVRLVVDTCLSRTPLRDAARGMTGLVTVPTPRASAIQRAGRATRQGPGTVIRCTDERTFAAAPARPSPEIAVADLTDAALLLACWGAPAGTGLRLLDAPPSATMDDALTTLRALGAIDAEGRATSEGRELARIPVDPRLARALLAGSAVIGAHVAAEVVALLSGDVRIADADIATALPGLRRGHAPESQSWTREARRLLRFVPTADASANGDNPADADTATTTAATTTRGEPSHQVRRARASDTDEGAEGLIVALAFPDRIARRVERTAHGASFLLASGTRAGVTGALADAEWLAVAEVARAEGRAAAGTGAVIRAAAVLTEAQAERAAAHLATDRVEAEFTDGRIVARRERRIGAIVRSSTPVGVQAAGGSADAVRRAIEREGLSLFRWSDAAADLRRRLALLHRELGAPWPDVSEPALLRSLDSWLAPELEELAAGRPAAKIDLAAPLRRLLPWPEAAELDALAPERLLVPSGSRVRIAYPEPDGDVTQPVVAVKLQECFGWSETPRLVAGRVPVLFHLLSPAGRPLATTSDLASFWSGPYHQVRAEMRGRYPKHPWPEDPWAAVPTRHTKKRAEQS
ncbi:ATP-dependent helicase HrpB [Microbacterium sp. NPDC055903]